MIHPEGGAFSTTPGEREGEYDVVAFLPAAIEKRGMSSFQAIRLAELLRILRKRPQREFRNDEGIQLVERTRSPGKFLSK